MLVSESGKIEIVEGDERRVTPCAAQAGGCGRSGGLSLPFAHTSSDDHRGHTDCGSSDSGSFLYSPDDSPRRVESRAGLDFCRKIAFEKADQIA
jgi:hypothetical protein